MEKEFLQKALDSILHGSTQIVSSVDSYGNLISNEQRINDLRIPLIDKIADKLVKTDGFQQALQKAFTDEVMKKIQQNILDKITYQDLPYRVKDKIQSDMENANLLVKRYKVTVEAITEEEVK